MDFKRALGVTTALSAVVIVATSNPVFAAEKPKLNFSGYEETFFGYSGADNGTFSSGTPTYTGGTSSGNTNNVHNNNFSILQYGELRIKVSGMTDSGMKWGAYAEKVLNDADRHSKTKLSTDENNIWLQGSWGKMEIGGQDGASDQMQVQGADLDLLGSNVIGAFVQDRGNYLRGGEDEDNVIDSSDDTKITYFTPRVSGFQAGVSYIPSLATVGTLPSGNTHMGIESAIRYNGKSGSTKYVLGAVYSKVPGRWSTSTDEEGYGLGAGVTFGKISLRTGFTRNTNWRTAGSHQHAWVVAANYNAGRWESTLAYTDAKLTMDNGSGDDKYHDVRLEGAYALGGGLTAALGVYNYKSDAISAANNNKGTAVIGKVNARF